MKAVGIRIKDLKENAVIAVKLSDILEEIPDGNSYYWSILFLEATGDLGPDRHFPTFENQINNSEKSLFITWEDLNLLATKFHQIIDMMLIASKNKDLINRLTEKFNEIEFLETDFLKKYG